MNEPVRGRLAARWAGSPLRHPAFRAFYAASVAAAIGYTMQGTVSAWLMASLTPSATMVALVQTASTLPTMLFGLVAGALSDILDRRRVILATQLAMMLAAALLGLAALAGELGPLGLLALTFALGCGFTFYLPAQQASINDLVSRAELPHAVALGAVAFNTARAAGPALAGALAAGLGAGSALLASTLFFAAMFLVVRRWPTREPGLPGVPERIVSGVRSGLRYAWHSPAVRALTVRNLCFSVCASAFWALLPLHARDSLALGAGGFGLLCAAFGGGAVLGAWSLPGLMRRAAPDHIVSGGMLLWIAALAAMAAFGGTAVALLGSGGAGAAWVYVLASLSAATQSAAPAWVRARAVSTHLVATQASLALGSVGWGLLAQGWGIRVALGASAAGMLLLVLVASRRFPIGMGTEADVLPRPQLLELAVAFEPLPDDGPVLIQVDYRIGAHDRRAFYRAIAAVGPTRRRSGATSWRVFRDLGDEERFVERFVVASWADYLRQRERMTLADGQLQERAQQYQRAGEPIRVSRLIGVAPDDAFLGTPESARE